jgi:hypothetical protein
MERRQWVLAHDRLAGERLAVAALADIDDHLRAGSASGADRADNGATRTPSALHETRPSYL